MDATACALPHCSIIDVTMPSGVDPKRTFVTLCEADHLPPEFLHYVVEACVPKDSPLVDKPAGEIEALGEGEVKLTTVVRERYRRAAVSDPAAVGRSARRRVIVTAVPTSRPPAASSKARVGSE